MFVNRVIRDYLRRIYANNFLFICEVDLLGIYKYKYYLYIIYILYK